MTLSEAQTERTNLVAMINQITLGGVESYQVGGGGDSRSLRRLSLPELYKRLTDLDVLIDRISNGTFAVASYRDHPM